jgi:mono/diheme cytochrome c family protein
MKVVLFIVLGLTALFFSLRPQDKVGKALFDQNCKSCHLPNKTVKLSETVSALSFQNIRKDYGVNWTVSFIQNNYKMHNKKDIRTLYS